MSSTELKKNRITQWKLYVIADRAAAGSRDLGPLVAAAIEGGADVIQYRNKKSPDETWMREALELRQITSRYGVPFIVNDWVDAARECAADGVHLGQEDASLVEARRRLGDSAIVGRSTHSPEQGRQAQDEGFDYIGVGPVFATPTKPDYQPAGLEYVTFASRFLRVPFVAIGGIDGTNLERVTQAGAKTVAVVRAVIGAADPRVAAAHLSQALFHREVRAG